MITRGYSSEYNKQYQLISTHHTVLLVDKLIDDDSYKFTYNGSAIQLPTYKDNTFYISNINVDDITTITANTWTHCSGVSSINCVVQYLTANHASAQTNTDDKTSYIATKYFIDWQKNNVYKAACDQLYDDGVNHIGHVSKTLSGNDYVLGAFNIAIGDGEKTRTIKMGGNTVEYNIGSDNHNIVTYTTCLFAVNNKNMTNNDVEGGDYSVVGFRRKYIVEISNKTLNSNNKGN